MKRLVVRLKLGKSARDLTGDGYRRPSRDELLQLARANDKYVQTCETKIRSAVPERLEVDAKPNLGLLIVGCPDTVDVEDLKKKIAAACSEVESVSSDFDIHLIK
jgi:hypothetical protein